MVRTQSQHTSLRDVAARAGVSVATASKALNGKADVAARTKVLVLQAAQELNFVPNELARSIAVRQTGTLGLLTHDLEGRFSLPILMGAEDAAGAGQMSVFLCDSRGDAIREQHHLKALMSRRVDGLIVVGGDTDPRDSLGANLGVPTVYAYAPSKDLNDMSVIPDNFRGGEMVVDHLVKTGRKHIAHITGPQTYSAATDRAFGVEAAIKSNNAELVGGTVLYGEWTESWGRTAAHLVMEQFENVDAIVTGSDLIARGVLDALRERRVDVPGRVAVTGYDNWAQIIEGARPALTSVDMNFETLGRRAAEKLMNAIAGTPEPGVEKVASTLVRRGSTELSFDLT